MTIIKGSINKITIDLSSSVFGGVMLSVGFYSFELKQLYLIIFQLIFAYVFSKCIKPFKDIVFEYPMFTFLISICCLGMGVVPLALDYFFEVSAKLELIIKLIQGGSFFIIFILFLYYFNASNVIKLGWKVNE